MVQMDIQTNKGVRLDIMELNGKGKLVSLFRYEILYIDSQARDELS